MGADAEKAAVTDRRRQFAVARMLGSAVTSQAVLSAASFAVGLLLIRHTSDLQYGYFILASSAVLLIAAHLVSESTPRQSHHAARAARTR